MVFKRPICRPRKDNSGYQPNGHEYQERPRSALERATESLDSRPNIGSDYTDDEREWLAAVEREQRRLGVITLTCAQVLALAKRLGYRLTEMPHE